MLNRSLDFSLRYFEGPNEQTGYLGEFFKQRHFLICSLERIASVGRAMGDLLSGRPLRINHVHRTRHEPAFASWRASVRWSEVRRFYDKDEELYDKVTQAGGCLARTSNARLRRALDETAAPLASWHPPKKGRAPSTTKR